MIKKILILLLLLFMLDVVITHLRMKYEIATEYKTPSVGYQELNFKKSYELAYAKAKEWKKDPYLVYINIYLCGSDVLQKNFTFASKEVPFWHFRDGENAFDYIIVDHTGTKILDESTSYSVRDSAVRTIIDVNALSPEDVIAKLKPELDSKWFGQNFALNWNSNVQAIPGHDYEWRISQINDLKLCGGGRPEDWINFEFNSKTGEIKSARKKNILQ